MGCGDRRTGEGPNALFGLAVLPIMLSTAISGIFHPTSALPGWLVGLAQVFPVYWMGPGTRSALLPDAAVTVGYLEHGEYSPYLALRMTADFEVPAEVLFSIEPLPRIGSQTA